VRAVQVWSRSSPGTPDHTAHDDQLLAITSDGQRARKVRVARDWNLIGWYGDAPVTASARGAAWLAPFVFAYSGLHLRRFDRAGKPVDETPVSRDRFDSECRRLEWTSGWPESLSFPSHLHLAPHPRLQRLVGWMFAPVAWVASFRPDGALDWVTMPLAGCCNRLWAGGDRTIAHLSCCGGCLSFLSPQGTVIRAHTVQSPSVDCTGDDTGSVFVNDGRKLYAFDADGEPRWELEVPGITRAAAGRDGRVYELRGAEGGLELVAVDGRR
jgi:hypothetical protein